MRERLWICGLAYLLDLCLGDPAWLPHPVAAIGAMIPRLEAWLYYLPRRRLAGVVLVLATVGITLLVVALTLRLASASGPAAHMAISVVWLWLALATRSLLEHGEAVRGALDRGKVAEARRAVARMVGRDTNALDASGIARACIESLAENLTDGCLSPLLFGLAGGPLAAWGLKAVSTLDSMVGYRSERYREFGWASARCDDALHFLPARSLWLLLPAASWLVNANPLGCWRAMHRDAKKTASPNSGLPEAGVAGALGIELGGPSVRTGVEVLQPRLNRGARTPGAADIRRAQWMVLVASALPLVFLAAGGAL